MNRPALALCVVVASSIVAMTDAARAAPPNLQPKPIHVHLEIGPQMIQQAAAILQGALTPSSPPSPKPPTPPPQQTTPSNSNAPGIVDLPVSDFGPAVVSVPLGATSARPVMVAAHGRGLDPRGSCDHWRSVFGDRHFILCPRGKPFEKGGFTFDNDIDKSRFVSASARSSIPVP